MSYTQQEIDVFQEWVRQQLDRGFVDTRDNGLMILESVPNGTPITLESLSAAAQAVVNRGHVLFGPVKSAAQKEFERVVLPLPEGTRNTISTWLDQQKRLVQTGDEGCKNVLAVVSFLTQRRYQITSDSLSMALTNLVNNAASKLYWNEVEQTYEPGRHSGKVFADLKKEEDRSFIGGRVNHALNPKIVNQSGKPVKDAYWQERAEQAGNAANTHSRKSVLRSMFVTKPGTTDIDWEQTALKREQAAAR